MKHWPLLALVVLLSAQVAAAQVSGTYHVFPQFADGGFSDGTFYQSHLVATAVTGPTACNISVYGLPPGRVAAAFTIPRKGASQLVSSVGENVPFASGYATLRCDQPVTANVAYTFMNPNEDPLSMATVFSSPPAITATVFLVEDARLGLAIANDTAVTGQYQVSVESASGQVLATTAVTIAPKSNIAKFVDEMLPLAPGYEYANVFVRASSASPAHVIGLLFFDAVFTTIPATVLDPAP
jgi:hypothetical protein